MRNTNDCKLLSNCLQFDEYQLKTKLSLRTTLTTFFLNLQSNTTFEFLIYHDGMTAVEVLSSPCTVI